MGLMRQRRRTQSGHIGLGRYRMLRVKALPAIAAGPMLIAAALAVPAASDQASAQASATACPRWNGVQPDGGSGASLASVVVLPSCEVLAVGTGSGSTTLAMRFEAGAWTRLATPSPASTASRLSGVAATSASNAWAVGAAVQSPGGDQSPATALILHWDGASWTSVKTPQPAGASGINNLAAVAADSGTDAWAVGHYNQPGGAFHSLILHWNGASWRQVPSPDPGGASRDASLTSVVIVSARNAWAAGWYRSASFFRQTLVLHWDGKVWRQMPSPNGKTNNGLLFGVTATSARNAWAVGYFIRANVWKTLVLHWNGRRWRQVPSPNPSPVSYNQLLSVAAISARDAWAVGVYRSPADIFQSLIFHWDGQSWKFVTNRSLGSLQTFLLGVAALASGNAWAVGEKIQGQPPVYVAMASQWHDRAWSPWPGL